MKREWTAAQTAAMNIRDRTLLVSAAAGSGKTATLTERIIRSLTDPTNPADLSEMLIVTFTRAAAAELRSRIFSALSSALAQNPSDRHLASQLMKLGSARICTIDSFYLEIIRSHFSTLGLSPSFRIADVAEFEVIQKNVMTETVDFFYESDTEFSRFAECFTGIRETEQLEITLLNLASGLLSFPEGIEFLKKSAGQTEKEAELDFFSTLFGQSLKSTAISFLRHGKHIFQSAYQYVCTDEIFLSRYGDSFRYLRDFCTNLSDGIEAGTYGYCEARDLLTGFQLPAVKPIKSELATPEFVRYKTMRTSYAAALKKLTAKSFAKTPETVSRAMHDTAHYTGKLYEVLSEYSRRLEEEKKNRNLLDFSDIRRYALKLTVEPDGTPTPIAREYAEQFSMIYIDEYQDVDRVQDMIFSALSRPDNRFMVGDIKQSIYGFRGAEPQVFAEYRAAFPPYSQSSEKVPATIFMSDNFRCDRNIIDFANLVCSYIFSFCQNSIHYQPQDDLVFSKPVPGDYISPDVNLAIIVTPKDTEEETDSEIFREMPKEIPKLEKRQWEALYIAKEIRRLIAEEKKADGTPIRPGDIAVLFRSRTMSKPIAEELHKLGIATSESDSSRYFENPDVLMMLSLLNTVDNPHRDIHLSGTLRSPVFGFSLEDLVKIRAYADTSHSLYDALLLYAQGEDDGLSRRCREFSEILDEWREYAAALPVDRFLRMVMDSECFLSSGLLCEVGESGNAGNLLRLYEYARNFEAGSFKGLYNFIEFINTIIENQKKIDSPAGGGNPDKVTLMTVHSSKGLEFPVCFVAGTANSFNRDDSRSSLLFDYPTGIAMKISDETGFARINTPMREAILATSAEKQIEEEMRVLYVALTRARERLYVTAATSKAMEVLLDTAEENTSFGDRYTVLHAKNYLEWILCALVGKKEQSCCRICFPDALSLLENEEESREDTESSAKSEAEPDEALLNILQEKYRFSYPYPDSRKIPAKISVSRLAPDVLDTDNDALVLFDSSVKTPVPDFFRIGSRQKKKATDRGTATHLFLQFCDFSYAEAHGIREEFARLCEKRFLPDDAEQLIYFDELEQFLSSELFTTIREAKKIIREQRFNLFLPSAEFTRNPELSERIRDEHLAVQGVIDLIVIDRLDRLCLYDYKTDRLSPAELADPALAQKKMEEFHASQLSYYAKAANMLFGRPCDRLAVYSTHAARLFDIEPVEFTVPTITV